ncbi:hypothetical protein THASP1DRAFT_33908 [Thamnocephalis sphaerospora]|uniref:Phosphoacetylglucosamine mutase n=1 Tax=Thamnocephalis sphaerospora TaxID=78915 RepID=A0A4V1IXI2_9FUNG|nr:hypothetical protein THASP1DRAFT_33908 [Thamnocephalis sphaerospora]|eukprot:RKP11149.1 hypothetical protein THASP1DRAFT_33908 [Thamnocephalis sphaerospora]
MTVATRYPSLVEAAERHPKPADVTYAYGTAGFRMKANLLDSVIFRAGVLAALRSKKLDGKTIGVMITASHNPAQDNGIKLVDPMGEMLEQTWEAYASQLANAPTIEELLAVVDRVIAANKIDLSKPANVVYARDTRPSGPALVAALADGLSAVQAQHRDEGILTTPQLHYIVRCLNTQGTPEAYGEPSAAGYYKKLADAYHKLVNGKTRLSPLHVDCANGVGAPKIREFAQVVGEAALALIVTNDDTETEGSLNYQCGADYVKVNQHGPHGVEMQPNGRYASLDGDADRLVYYYMDNDRVFHLLDGDKIAGLAAMFIKDLVTAAGLEGINVGTVQTAYANGSSTNYLTNILQVPVSCTQTGVKHLHHEAEKYDVGVYFEANGHGTVLFSPVVLQAISDTVSRTPAQALAIAQLRALTDMINQTVGDAISDLLLVEVILTHKQWTLSQWDQAYTDLPSRLVRVVVKDRNIFRTINADRQLESPAGMQALIDGAVAKFANGRSFVRPSGTEDVVRVYAEAATRHECDELAFRVAGLVFDNAGGLGDRPAEFL